MEYGYVVVKEIEPTFDTVRRSIAEGASDLDLADNHFCEWVKFRNSFKEYRRLKMGQRDWPMEVHFYYGPPVQANH